MKVFRMRLLMPIICAAAATVRPIQLLSRVHLHEGREAQLGGGGDILRKLPHRQDRGNEENRVGEVIRGRSFPLFGGRRGKIRDGDDYVTPVTFLSQRRFLAPDSCTPLAPRGFPRPSQAEPLTFSSPPLPFL